MGTPVNFASHLAWPLGVALAILLAVLVAFLFVRRGYRHQYFRRLDEAREECEPVLEGVFSGSRKGSLPCAPFPGAGPAATWKLSCWLTRTPRWNGRQSSQGYARTSAL